MINKSLFSYKKKILKVSQLAAIAVHAQIGQKNETEADRLAVESMRSELNKISFAGKIVRSYRLIIGSAVISTSVVSATNTLVRVVDMV